jgi:hypothetical protein
MTMMSKELSLAMKQALALMAECQLPLIKVGGGWWGFQGHDGWKCSGSTVRALTKRGLICSLDGDDALAAHVLATSSGPPSQDIVRVIRERAYFISLERLDGDVHAHWYEAERQVRGTVEV